MSSTTLRDVCCARLPHTALPVLAVLRHLSDVRIRPDADRTWVWWPAERDEVLRCILAAPGVELYEQRDGLWYRHGHALPAFHVPDEDDSRPLAHVLTPAPVQPADVPTGTPHPVSLRLVRDSRPRVASTLRAHLRSVATWVDTATTARLEALSAAVSGGTVLLRGRQLPALADAERCWGNRLLCPLGFRPEPALPERALREALGVGDTELALFTTAGVEIVPLDAFEPLTRAGVRLALAACGLAHREDPH